jgi:uncharacterized coiled-coil DUF342 family protein
MKKDEEILQQIALLKSKIEEVNDILKELNNKGMFVIVSYNERERTNSPILEIKTAIQHIDYLKD